MTPDDGPHEPVARAESPATDGDDGRLGDLDRRDWLQALGGAALLGAAGGTVLSPVATAAAQTGDAARTADRSLSVDERIRRYRTGDLTVVVEDRNGQPVEGAEVSIAQRAHDFGWGTAVNADTLLNGTSEGDEYRTYITDLFNTAVLENRHKWRFWEEQQALADEATQWLLDRGMDLRGHVCVWGNRDAYAVPENVETAVDEGDGETVRQRSVDHIESIVSHYGDDVEEWEVVNEVIHEPSLIETVDGTDVDPVEAPILGEWYRQAAEVRPDGVSLAVNDYNTLAGPYDYARSAYERQIDFLQGEGVDLGSAGMQCHFSQSETVDTEGVLDQLDAYGQYGLDLKVTEFDMADDGWDESAKADFFEGFLRAVFSHPAVTDFLVWGFWDGRHWQNDAPLFFEDWSAKPSHDVYTSLVFEEWWTDETGTSDAGGTYATSAFLGEHEITVSTSAGETTTTTSVTDADGTTTVTVTVAGGSDTGTGGSAGSSGDGGPGSSGGGNAGYGSGGDGWWGSGTGSTGGSDGSGGGWWGSNGSDTDNGSGGWW